MIMLMECERRTASHFISYTAYGCIFLVQGGETSMYDRHQTSVGAKDPCEVWSGVGEALGRICLSHCKSSLVGLF